MRADLDRLPRSQLPPTTRGLQEDEEARGGRKAGELASSDCQHCAMAYSYLKRLRDFELSPRRHSDVGFHPFRQIQQPSTGTPPPVPACPRHTWGVVGMQDGQVGDIKIDQRPKAGFTTASGGWRRWMPERQLSRCVRRCSRAGIRVRRKSRARFLEDAPSHTIRVWRMLGV